MKNNLNINHNWLGIFKWIVFCFSIFYFSPFLILGENSYFTVHDNLDSEVQYLEVLKSSGTMYETKGTHLVQNTMNGIPRAAYKSGLNFTSFLFSFFSAHWAYIFNFIFTHIIAFIAMYLFLKTHVLKEENHKWLLIVASFLFSILPFYSIYGLTIAGQPLLFFSFLHLRNNTGKIWQNYLIISLFPFFVIGYLVSPFLIIIIGIVWLFDLFRTKRINTNLLIGILLLIFLTLLADYQMYSLTLANADFVSHRTEWDITKLMGLTPGFAFQSSITLFFETSYHSGSMPTKVILVLFLLALSVSFNDKKDKRLLLIIFVSIILICAFYSIYFYLVKYLGNKILILKIFQWNRFSFILPFLWIIILTISVVKICRYKVLYLFLGIMLSFQTVYIIRKNKEVIYSWKLLLGKKIDEPNFARFYSKDLFSKIAKFINKPKSTYRVASLGINPAVASFNGFYTLDGYQNSYDVNYKHEFRKIIKKDLEAEESQRNYFDYWGSRCYLISNSYLKAEIAKQPIVLKLDFDFEAYKKLGGQYLLSNKKIIYPDSCGLFFNKKFTDTNSDYNVYLYKVK